MVVMAERWLQLPLDIIHIVFKYSCTNWTAIDPSPTAEATRLTEPERTSPAANTPGWLVSRRNGCRRAVQWGDSARAAPVRTNSLSSRSISGGSQSVYGTAPMKLKSAGVSSRRRSPVLWFRISMAPRWPSLHALDRGVVEHLDVFGLLDAMGEVARHLLVQIVAAQEEVDLPRLAGEEDRGLAGGVAAADHHHLRSPAERRLVQGRGVVDAGALELRAAFGPQPAVLGAGCDQQALGGDRLAALELQHRVGVDEGQADDRRGHGQARPELVGLEDGALRQLAAGQAGGEAQVVLDPHAAAGLAAGPGALQDDGVEPLGGAVDRRRQPRRPRPDHDQVVDRVVERLADPQGVRQLAVPRVTQEQLVAPGDDRGVGRGHAELFEQPGHRRIIFQVEPGEEQAVAGQEVADAEGILGVAGAEDAEAGEVSRLAQELPAGDEGLQDDVGQIRRLTEDLPQGRGRHLVDLAVAPGDGADHRRPAGQVRHVAGELPGSMDGDGFRRLARFVHDLDLAGADDEELEIAIAGLDEPMPILIAPERGAGAVPEGGDLRFAELGEGDGF